MTVHSAKGLEFAYVFVMNMVDRQFPTSERGDAIDLPDALVKEITPEGDIHLEEERRLFYVALTRAKRAVFLTSASDYGGARHKKISRFLVELGFAEPTVAEEQANATTDFGPATTPPATVRQMSTLVPKMFSFSQLAAFDKCPLQYKYQFLLKIPVPGRPNFSFGKTMHSVLEKIMEDISAKQAQPQKTLFATAEPAEPESLVPAWSVIEKFYDESWQDDWYPSDKIRQSYRDKGREILQRVRKELMEKLPHPLALEKDFRLKLGHYPDQVTFIGRIDRLDQVDGGVEIVDYKTGNAKESWIPMTGDNLPGIRLRAKKFYSLSRFS